MADDNKTIKYEDQKTDTDDVYSDNEPKYEDDSKEVDDINKTKELLAQKEEEINDLNNKITRLQADFLNYKKRSEKEKEESINFGIQTVITDLLPIIDNFERALDAAANKEDSFYKGVEMIKDQLYDLLEKYNIKEIKALGEKFDPNIHYAISTVDAQEEAGTVVEVYQKGYLMEDKVVRPSMVIVSK
ncbi:MAG TPA: nucleotide exchange factor GrpE [Soehngenia sp.]|nr:nucleotide exchange factor GrpE [Soehngenia sp.]